MSRTVRRLPVGDWKKYGRKNYYRASHRRFEPQDIHVLKTRPKPQCPGEWVRRFGLYLHAPSLGYYNRTPRYPIPYRPDELRPSKNSIAGPLWIDQDEFETEKVKKLLSAGWSFNHRYEQRQRSPEEGDVDFIEAGPDFGWQYLWKSDPDYDRDLDDDYHFWREVHTYVHRNGHYKDQHPGHKWRRRQKQAEHQLERSRLKAALHCAVREALELLEED